MYTAPLRALIDELGRLPGIGPKSAQRIAFYLLKVPSEDALRLSDAIVTVKESTGTCERCFNVSERGQLCEVCDDARRDSTIVCVVEDPRDIAAVERTQQFRGLVNQHSVLFTCAQVDIDLCYVLFRPHNLDNEPMCCTCQHIFRYPLSWLILNMIKYIIMFNVRAGGMIAVMRSYVCCGAIS